MRYLVIDKCPHGIYAIALDNDGSGSGTRLTPTRCCGQWGRERAWSMSDDDLRKIANAILDEVGE